MAWTMWAKWWSELPVAISLRDAVSISEVRLPRPSVVALISGCRLCQNVSAYRPDCLFQAMIVKPMPAILTTYMKTRLQSIHI